MKHLLYIFSLAAAITLTACGNDEPGGGGGKRTMQPTMLNHVVDINTHQVTMEAAPYTLVLSDGYTHVDVTVQMGTQRSTVAGCNVSKTSDGFFSFGPQSDGNLTALNGYIDFNEGNFKCQYTLDNRYRVIATLPEVFFLSTTTTLSYEDGTSSSDASTMYQFTINPATRTATIYVMSMLHAQEERFFESIVAHNAQVTATPDGYHITVADADCGASFRRYDSATGSGTTATNEYKFTDFVADVNLEQETMTVSFDLKKMKRSATPQEVLATTHITATGSTYSH